MNTKEGTELQKKMTLFFFNTVYYTQAIIYDFFPYQKCKKSEVAIPEGAAGTEGLFLEGVDLSLKYHRCPGRVPGYRLVS